MLAKIECRRCQMTELTQPLTSHSVLQEMGCQDQELVLFLTEFSTQDKTYYLSSFLVFRESSDPLSFL